MSEAGVRKTECRLAGTWGAVETHPNASVVSKSEKRGVQKANPCIKFCKLLETRRVCVQVMTGILACDWHAMECTTQLMSSTTCVEGCAKFET